MEKHLLLAKVLSEIHSHSLYPYYSKKPSKFWQELEDRNLDKNEVDKEFFIKMAKGIIDMLDAESNSSIKKIVRAKK